MTSVVGSFEEIRLSIALRRTGGTSAAGLCSNASRLRTFWFDALRLAGRVALAQLRTKGAVSMPNIKPARDVVDLGNGTLRMDLNRDVSTIFDAVDFALVTGQRWYAVKGAGGAGLYVGLKRLVCADGVQKRVQIYMHRVLLGAPAGMLVDHVNGDKLDNRRCNLRLCDGAGNSQNRSVGRNNTTGYKGVAYKDGKFDARIGHGKRSTYLGRFETVTDAARAYDTAARRHHGDFAVLNFPEEVR